MENYTLQELQPLVLNWSREKDLLKKENAPKQQLKLIEECGELSGAIVKNKVKEQKDAIGDIFVVTVNLSEQLGEDYDFFTCPFETDYPIHKLIEKLISEERNKFDKLNTICDLLGLDLVECANIAWNEIKNRKGKTINGTFIKNEN